MRYALRCNHCLGNSAPLCHVDTISAHEEGVLRHHLRTAHPHLGDPHTLGEVLKHFTMSPVDADG